MKQFSKDLGNVCLAPKGKWSREQEYERLALVYNACDNLSYVAKINVPSGVDIENREYWQPMNATGYADNNFINLTTESETGTVTAYESLEEAVATILPINRRAGATLSFYNLNADRLDRQAEFELWQFNSTDLANWENRNYWNNIYYNWNVFAGWYVGADALKNHVETPNVGQYAYVGSNLNDALLYQCRTNGTWTNTGIKVRNYISVVVKGNITIGDNGNWFSDGEDTGIPATPAVDEQLDNIIAKHESLSRTVQGIAVTGGASTATNVTYNNDSSRLNAENAQDAIDELATKNATKVEKAEVTAELEKKFDKESILQESGEAEDKVMSQKAITTAIANETTRAKAAEKTNAETITNEVARLDEKINDKTNEINVAKEEALQTIAENEQSAIANFNSQRVTPEMLSESTKQLIETSGGGTITNLADDEDITSVDNGTGSNVLKFADRTYNPDNFNGKGYKILRKNIQSVNIASTKITITEVPSSDGILSFTINGKETQVAISATTDNTTALVAQKVATALQDSMTEYNVSIDASLITLTRKSSGLVTPSVFSASTTGVVCTITDSTKREFRNILISNMINQPNTIYEIRYDFDLNNNKIELHENSILYFTTGSLKNGTLDCNDSVVLGNVNINGIIDNIGNKEVDFSWFTNDDYFYENFKNTINSKKVKAINLENKTYNINGDKKIVVSKSLYINGNNATLIFDTIQGSGCFCINKVNDVKINNINVKLSPSNLTKEGTMFYIVDVTNVVLNNCKIETFGYCTSLWLHDNTKNITINDCIINRISENNDNNVGGAFWIQNYGDSEVRHITINNTIFNYRGTDEALAFWTHNKGSINEIIFNNCILNVLENSIKQIMPISLTVYKELADSDLIFKQCTFNIFNKINNFIAIRGRGTTGEQQYVKLDKKCLFKNCNINIKSQLDNSFDDVEFYNSSINCTSIQGYGKFYDCNIKLNNIMSYKATFKKCNIESNENSNLYLLSNSNHALDCVFDSCNISLSNQMPGLINLFNVKDIRLIFVNNIVHNIQDRVIRLVGCGEHITVSNNIFLNSDNAKVELYDSKNLIFSNNICTFSLNDIGDSVNVNLNSIIFTNNTYIDTENNTKHFYLYGTVKYINSDANIKNPIKGMISIMENKDNALTYYDGSAWKALFKDYGKGATNSRPTLTTTDEGFEYYDSTLKKKILWNGNAWVNLDGTELS